MPRKKKILIIDDEAALTRMLKKVLEKKGSFDVKEENKGSCAVAAAKSFHPDLIILDVIMPDTEGFFVASEIKKDDELKSIPIVFLTATAVENELFVHETFKTYKFLSKPVDIATLIDVITIELNKNEKK